MANGYAGKILEVNLTAGNIQKVDLPADIAENFLGGKGLGAQLLWDRIQPGVDPLGPDNVLVIATGPLTGTPIPAGSRFVAYCKSPLTSPLSSDKANAGGVGWALGGGMFAPELKYAGYDAIVFTGKAGKPSYLFIDGDTVELRDAAHLWGQGTDRTDILMREELGDDFRTIMIGPAGENLVPMACILTESSRSAGRGGTGAVMGSKNLKAIAVRGHKMVEVANLDKVLAMRKGALEASANGTWPGIENQRKWGTTAYLSGADSQGLWVTRNAREGSFEKGYLIQGALAERTFWVRHRSCNQCPMHCMKLGVIPTGPYKGTIAEGPEYETGTMLGSNLMLEDLNGMMKAIGLCDDLGLDQINVGNVIGFVMEAYENGLVTKADLDGAEATWGNVEATLQLLDMVAYKKGFGEVMGKGTRATAQALGGGSEHYAMETKNHGYAAHGVQNNPKRGMMYATSNRGGCHMVNADMTSQNARSVENSLVVCSFVTGGINDGNVSGLDFWLEYMNAVTGWGWSTEQFMQAGDRIWNIEKMFNVREGFRREDDYLAERVHTDALTVGAHAGAVFPKGEFQQMLDDYYTERGWDVATSIPTAEHLKSLGLEDAAQLASELL